MWIHGLNLRSVYPFRWNLTSTRRTPRTGGRMSCPFLFFPWHPVLNLAHSRSLPVVWCWRARNSQSNCSFLASAERCFIAAMEDSYCFSCLQQFLAHSENLMRNWMNDLRSCHDRCVHDKSLHSCMILCNPMDHSPRSSVHGVFHARILEWVAMPFSRESSQSRDQTWISCIAGRFYTSWAIRDMSRV